MTEKKYIIGGELMLYRIALNSEPMVIERGVTVQADDGVVYVHHWEIHDEKVLLRYSMRDDLYAPLFTGVFPLYSRDTPVSPPRGRGWAWQDGRWVRYTRRGREQAEAA